MHDELTQKDIAKMQEELDYRSLELRPQLIEEVKRTRAFGDLSENFEYKEAKRAKNRNDSRVRYLTAMISTAKIIEDIADSTQIGLFDKVTVYMPDDDETEVIQVVTTIRCDPLNGLISKESPFGKSLLGKTVGERITVHASADYSYDVIVRSIEKTDDDGSAPILAY